VRVSGRTSAPPVSVAGFDGDDAGVAPVASLDTEAGTIVICGTSTDATCVRAIGGS
jgi:hypothetical protein